MIKPKLWKGNDLLGGWEVTYKVDGVRCLITDGVALSRSGKPLYNIPSNIPDGDYEVYAEDWESSVSLVRTKDAYPIDEQNFWSISPLDARLHWGNCTDPDTQLINLMLEKAVGEGYEGLVLRQGDKWLKVKPTETYDVEVTGVQAGTGKHGGRMGALLTDMGKVGTGFTDLQREDDYPVGTIIEVECMSLTPNGKFRHPRFKRVRWDK